MASRTKVDFWVVTLREPGGEEWDTVVAGADEHDAREQAEFERPSRTALRARRYVFAPDDAAHHNH